METFYKIYFMPDSNDEQILLEGLKRCDSEAFRLLIQTYKNKIANISYRFLFNREDAEEVTQEVFIDIYKGIGSFRGDSRLSTWIYQLAMSRSIDLIRSRKRKKRFGKVISLLGFQDETREIPDPQAEDPVQNFENEEKGRIIREAIDTLSINYRQAFTLSKCEGFTNKEVAEIMGTSLSNVETLIHRASKKLRELLYAAFEKELLKNSKRVQDNPVNVVSKKVKLFFILCALKILGI